jgi:hypothetical protein
VEEEEEEEEEEDRTTKRGRGSGGSTSKGSSGGSKGRRRVSSVAAAASRSSSAAAAAAAAASDSDDDDETYDAEELLLEMTKGYECGPARTDPSASGSAFKWQPRDDIRAPNDHAAALLDAAGAPRAAWFSAHAGLQRLLEGGDTLPLERGRGVITKLIAELKDGLARADFASVVKLGYGHSQSASTYLSSSLGIFVVQFFSILGSTSGRTRGSSGEVHEKYAGHQASLLQPLKGTAKGTVKKNKKRAAKRTEALVEDCRAYIQDFIDWAERKQAGLGVSLPALSLSVFDSLRSSSSPRLSCLSSSLSFLCSLSFAHVHTKLSSILLVFVATVKLSILG